MRREPGLFLLPDVGQLQDFYGPAKDGERNLFEVWETGGARGDSVTPSVFSPAYRAWMRDKLLAAFTEHEPRRLLSLGSGNAAVERELARSGVEILAVDALQEAVDLARDKGLDAIRADVTSWTPVARWPVIYCDGLLGHLYDPDTGLAPVLARFRSWMAATGGSLIVSNDSPKDDSALQAAAGVPGFHWLSGGYLRREALAAGFTEVAVETFRYERPLSGERLRAVVTAVIRP